ncbi:Phage-related protein, tail component [Moraxella catarrhalis 7169]|uniref:TipJ family phage tail tip protein n=1 Tax=Moraxella catarrhalis TaxID=480 RepID=UPI000202994C|nr:phage tail protein [Moraxella catarrhalis]EGE12682.1 Phage-related protein, tail component [Moraxella catarrhalis 7169]
MTIHGAKKGGGKQRQPIIAPDSAQSKTYIKILYGLGEGEIAGLADGYKSVYLDDTPLQNDDGEFNFQNVKVDFRAGTNDQTYIDGFADVANETNVGVELKHGTPWVKSFNNLDLDALRVRIKWGALRQQNRDNGDVSGVKIDYAIDVKTDNGGWVEALNTSINAKTSNAYERSHRIDLPKAGTGWAVRVRRITPNSTSELVSDTMYISAITEVIDLKLRYPNTALLGLRYDAEQFSNVAKMSARCRGLIIKVPTNYNPTARTYDGLWDGQFKLAYCNNPAWVYYDLCTATRYGLGGRLTEYMIDKWSLYRLAQYCDHMVDDGMGGQEPRFAVNVYIQSAEGAFELLSKLAGVFRAISYWDGTSIVLDADIPQDSIYSFSRANVIDGIFEYTGTRARDRHTVAKVAWDNPANHFKTEYEYVRDEKAIAKFGVRVADIQAWGCTSKGQAQRAGLWALKSEQLETRMVTFKVGLDGYIPAPAKVIEISDELFAGRATGGRVLAINKTKTVITLDRAITAKAGDTLVINGDDGTSQRRQISAAGGDNVTVTKPFSDISEQNVWVLDSQDLATMKFRVLSVTADDNHEFTITAVQYNPVKYDAIDTGAVASERPISVINPTVQAPTKSVNLSSYHTVNQGVTVTTLVIGWEQVTGAVKYAVEWRKDNGNWQTLPPTGTNSIEITGVYAGQYEARVTAISAFGQASLATHSNLTQIQGKQGKPPRPINFTAQGVLFGMNLGWNFAKGSGDTNYTEIQVSPDGRTNIATLGTFAYPTNKHEITGLQGNLTQFYRARIVDKLGNTSDWTDWASGTTSANADKVLDILSGQISQSHLDQSLRTPIGKIGTIESNISKINVDLPELNQSIADAQSTLNTAVASIDTEKKRLSSAIVDINTLKQSNNAKTQEIANLTQTVSGHTSQVRELGVTTGDLSQKYSQLKTTSDTANSEITTIKQTQSGQATSVERLRSELANKASTSSVNSLSDSLATKERALSRRIRTVESTASGNTSSINTLNQSLATTNRALTTKQEQLTAQLANKASTASVNSLTESLANKEQALSRRIRTVESTASGNTSSINTLNQSLTDKERALTTKQEQLTAQLANKASVASISTLNQSLTTKERALTEQINRAKSEMGGRITQISNETRTLTDANRTIGERINQLNSELAGADSISDNLLINSNRTLVTGAYLIATYRISETLANGDKVRLTVIADIGINRTGFMAYNSNSAGGSKLADISESRGNVYTAEFEWNVGTGGNNELRLYHNASNTRSISTITSVSLQKITTGSGLASIKSSVANLERTLTTTNQSLAERINTVQTTLNGQTASIQQHAQTLNGLSAQWTLKVQSGGIVSGIGLASNNGVSDFAVIADKFYVASPQGDKKPMFSVITRPTSINGTTVPAVVSLNGDLIGSGTISGDKIRANTQITAPNIRGGSISIGSNFSVDSQGNLNANSGVFRGQVLADKITGQIDVESLKSSAVALGYDMFFADTLAPRRPSEFDRTFKSSYASYGSIIDTLNGAGFEKFSSVMYEIRVLCKRAITVKQKLYSANNEFYCFVNNRSIFGEANTKYGNNTPNYITVVNSREISLSLRQGLNTIQFIVTTGFNPPNSAAAPPRHGGGRPPPSDYGDSRFVLKSDFINGVKHYFRDNTISLMLVGDFIDNNIIKFA